MGVTPRCASMQRAQGGHTPQARGTALTRVALRNFKGHANLRLDLEKITVLIGPTGSGKSTVFHALNLLKSALEADGLGVLDGRSREHGSFADIAARRNPDAEVGIDIGGRRAVSTRAGGDVSADFSYGVSFGRSLRPSWVRAAVDVRRSPARPGDAGMRLEYSRGPGGGSATVRGPGAEEPPQALAPLPAGGGLAPRASAGAARRPLALAFNEMFSGGEFFRSLLGGLWHVPFSRAAAPLAPRPERGGGGAAAPPQGRAGHAARKRMAEMMREVGLGRLASVCTPASGGGSAAPGLGFAGADALGSIAHEGSGPLQLAGLLSALACSPRGSIVTVEEPEMHLDPAAQARLMGILVRQATQEGKQIVFTTHSDHLLFPLLAYVAKDGCPLGCGDVAMHYFNTDGSGGAAGAERLAINRHGQIRGGLKGFWCADGLAMSEILG